MLRCDIPITPLKRDNNVTCLQTCGCYFVFPTECYGVYKIEVSHIGKKTEKHDPVCKKLLTISTERMKYNPLISPSLRSSKNKYCLF